MAHDAFISYASEDKPIADGVCATLERHGVRCWIAPRDVVPGRPWAEAITEAMKGSQVAVLVFSSHANESQQISREVNLAASGSVPIIPFRIEDVEPSGSLAYFISDSHWLDALTPEMEKSLDDLATTVRRLVPDGVEDTKVRLLRQSAAEQYRAGVQAAWADKRLREAEARHLEGLAARLKLAAEEKESIEQEVLGGRLEDAVAASQPTKPPPQPEPPVKPEPAVARFCRKCGAKATGAKFCRHCGAPLSA